MSPLIADANWHRSLLRKITYSYILVPPATDEQNDDFARSEYSHRHIGS